MDHYEVLGVSPGATLSELRRAYRQRVLELHPDRNPDPDAEVRFHRLRASYMALREAAALRDGYPGPRAAADARWKSEGHQPAARSRRPPSEPAPLGRDPVKEEPWFKPGVLLVHYEDRDILREEPWREPPVPPSEVVTPEQLAAVNGAVVAAIAVILLIAIAVAGSLQNQK